ncbi:hypothetical protein ACOI1C_05155 [Bacillus sp. DJP31]|uniref:hypothetical protein n=1 Tax=Bacillus sp. DJP31 TaxID=3409789 RepID=UPI003BB48906
MQYVIDRANLMKDRDIERCSFSIKNNKFDYIRAHMDNMSLLKMDASPYLLTPGHVMLDFKIEKLTSFSAFKERMKELIGNGCTTVLISVTVHYETELVSVYKKIQHLMINSPIDYCIGVRIPFRVMTPDFIRQCKRLKIPVVFIEAREHDMYKMAWTWIRDALYPYYLPIVPLWSQGYSKGKVKKLTEEWKELLNRQGIPTIPFCPSVDAPLSLNVLRKIGISPLKGEIRIGADVDYNLYAQKSREVANVGEVNYDMNKPIITVHNGRCIRAGDKIFINPGFGSQVCIKVPGFFASTF